MILIIFIKTHILTCFLILRKNLSKKYKKIFPKKK